MKNKKFAVLGVTLGLSVLSCIPAFAGQWKQDTKGWWYQEDNGSYPASTWKWIDGNGDGVAECYYFNTSGYMLSNTSTPDSYSVNNDGAWTVNGVVQTKQVSLNADNNENSDINKYTGTYVWKNGVVKTPSEKLIFTVKNGKLAVESQTMYCEFDSITLENGEIVDGTHEFNYEGADGRYLFVFYDNRDYLAVFNGTFFTDFVRE